MKKAILGVLALGLPMAALAANGEREYQHGSMAAEMEPAVRFELSRDQDSGRLAVPLRQIATRRSLSEHHLEATSATRSVMPAPEIDPASAVSGLTLLLGGIAVLRGRKVRASE